LATLVVAFLIRTSNVLYTFCVATHSDELRAHLKSAPKPTPKVEAESSGSSASSSGSDSDDSGLQLCLCNACYITALYALAALLHLNRHIMICCRILFSVTLAFIGQVTDICTKYSVHIKIAWTIAINCSAACLTALSMKFSPSRMPPLSFSVEIFEGSISHQFCLFRWPFRATFGTSSQHTCTMTLPITVLGITENVLVLVLLPGCSAPL